MTRPLVGAYDALEELERVRAERASIVDKLKDVQSATTRFHVSDRRMTPAHSLRYGYLSKRSVLSFLPQNGPKWDKAR